MLPRVELDHGAVVARIAGTQFERAPPIIAGLAQSSVDLDFRYLRDEGR